MQTLTPIWIVWVPVIAALGASILTNLGNVGLYWLQRRKESKAAVRKEQAEAYGDLLARTSLLHYRAMLAGVLARSHSGLEYRLNLLFRFSRPIDFFEMTRWTGESFQLVTDAWLRVWVVGSQDAVDAADRLMDAAGGIVSATTSLNTDQSAVSKSIRGEVWSEAQRKSYDDAVRRISREHVAFAKVVRKELGRATIEFALERAQRKSENLD